MRKILLGILLFCSCSFVFAQNLKVKQNTYDKVSISFAADSILVEDVSVSEGTFAKISMDGYGFSYNPGAPQLPQLTKLLQIPVCDSVVATVVNVDFEEYDAADLGIRYPLYPSQLSLPRNVQNPPFSYNQAIYTANEFYALPLVSVEKTGIRRNLALANVYFSPVQYNPVTNRIRIYMQIDVEFSFINTNMTMTNRLKQYASPMFELDTDMVVNKMRNAAKNEYQGAPIKYLIVANSMFSSNTDLAAFAEWKRRLGYKVEVAYTSDANVGTTTTSIKNFIQNKYNNATTADPAPTFLLLIGDVAQLPAFSNQTSEDHVTDLYYATLAGNDNIPDCYYGRLSATNNTQLSNQIAKIMMYEQYSMPDPSYLGNAVLIAGTDGNGYSPTHADGQVNYIYNNYINTSSTTHQYTNVYKHNYNCSSQAATIRNEINAGVGLANYTAHGSSSGWADPAFSTSHVSSMTNTNKYGLLIGNCCLSGKFDDSECFGESLLRAANKGAMGYIGASNSSYWNEDVYWAVGVRSSISANMTYNASKLGVYDKMFHTHNEAYSNWVSTIGGIIQGGNLSVQSSSSSRKKYYWEIYHCFGDPSVRVYLGMPRTMSVIAESTIPVSSENYTAQVAPYAYVALKRNTTEFVAAAFANANGNVTLAFSAPLEIGNYELVALAQNYIPYFQAIEVIDDGNCRIPTNLNVTNVTAFTATLSWSGESGLYNIELKTETSDWVTIATGVTASTYTLTSLQENTSYQVRVQSVCNGETSHWKKISFVTPEACPAPTDLVCSAFTVNTATLNWTENGSASSWTLQYGTNSNFASGTYTQVTVSGNPLKTLSGLTAETTYYARVRANCGGIYGISQWSAINTFMPSAVQTVEIGDEGTSNNQYLPSYNYYNYCFSQQIYKPDEIGVAGTIKSIAFKNTGEEKTRTYCIYLKHIDKETFESTSDWVSVSNSDLVFSGEVIMTVGEWTKINFTTPFVFNGESNLLVTVADTTGSYTSSPHMTCLVFNATGQAIYAYRDTPGAYDIAAPGGSGTVLNVKNQIQIDIVPSSGSICLRPKNLIASNVTANAATLSWSESGTANEWVLQYGTNSDFTSGTYTQVMVSGNISAILTGLIAETTYYARVKAVCGAGDESLWSIVCAFTPSIKTIVGSGTATCNYLPTNNYYKYSLTQQIYTPAELGEAGDILSIDFYKNATIECNRNLDIYMVSTTKSTFTSTSDWITVTAANNVFSGTVNFADNDWTTITFDTPFFYDGTSNVAIIVDDNTGSFKSNTAFRTFSANSQAIRIYNDNTNFDAFSPSSYSGTVESTKNQIRILKSEPRPCPDPTEFSMTICESFSWNGEVFTTSGDYTRIFTIGGCDSVVTLHLTINSPVHAAVTEIACEAFTWHGTTYTTSGDYTYSHEDANGCMQVDTLHLTINNPVHTAVTDTACGSYTWNGTIYTETGDYTYTHEDANGCTQVDTLHLTIHNPVHTAVTDTACGSYTWNGTTYTETGDYTYTHEDANGCTQVDTLHLTINNPIHTAVTDTACGSYTWNGTTYTESGDYTYSHEDANGCMRVDTLHLTIHNPVHTEITETACESYIWHGTTYTTSGDYTYSHEDANGCTQVDTLHLTIHNPVHTAVTDTACGSYIWHGTTYTTSGDYTYSHEDANG
ncbi:MAG: fibronectin type III domain-containing protein, partial [Bacteroidales bacterium]|nr:fibronectin type III domain-containing protein [Bacteroidales bacterium]